MGKRFYGTHADKATAMKLADKYAKKYKKGKCYTPSSRIPNACVFDPVKLLWTCRSSAHHHWGSCGSKEITSPHQRGGTNWEIPLPPIDFKEAQPIDQSIPNNESGESPDEVYTDALPEEYEEISLDDLDSDV